MFNLKWVKQREWETCIRRKEQKINKKISFILLLVLFVNLWFCNFCVIETWKCFLVVLFVFCFWKRMYAVAVSEIRIIYKEPNNVVSLLFFIYYFVWYCDIHVICFHFICIPRTSESKRRHWAHKLIHTIIHICMINVRLCQK